MAEAIARAVDPQREIGLVFSGGGLKGGYEIGVWKALNEKGITPHITAVSGTSVGALNGMLFALGDYTYAENLWLGVTAEDLMYLPGKADKSAEDAVKKVMAEAEEAASMESASAEADAMESAQATAASPSPDGAPAATQAAPAGQTTPAETAAKAGRLARLREMLREVDFSALLPGGVPAGQAVQQLLGEGWQALVENGVFSQQKLQSMIDGCATPERVAALKVDAYATCSRVKKMSYLLDMAGGTESVTFDLRARMVDYRDILLASAAIPVVYPAVTIDGDPYVDGGVAPGGNTPVAPLYRRGYRKIIVVYLQKKPEYRIRKRDFPFAEFAEIIPGEELYTGPLAAMYMPQNGTSSEIEAGYCDTMGTCTFI